MKTTINKPLYYLTLFCIIVFSSLTFSSFAQQKSVARKWNEVLLESIRHDLARPTVHARNLFHVSTAMYDAWAAYEDSSQTYFLGKTVGNHECPFTCMGKPANKLAAQNEAISYACYRLLKYRFKKSPGAAKSLKLMDSLFVTLGYDSLYTSINYASDSAAALGNYIAHHIIEFGQTDGSNEQNNYKNKYYQPVNESLLPEYPGNPKITNCNRWQPLSLKVYIDQGGNPQPGDTIPFLSPEWGNVVPFCLNDVDRTDYQRDGNTYRVFHDPGKPPYLSANDSTNTNEFYRWTFSLVANWSSHLDPSDGVMWDISPASMGNIPFDSLPTTFDDHPTFYKKLAGGDLGKGYDLNPHTGQPYPEQIVPRGDYTRVLAEFWADGPNSETPPGHWFTLLNDVSDHPELEKKWKGEGPVLDNLEWDVKCYFTLGGTMHDVAISSWSIKGWYDYLRPVSAIRFMADQGQCTNPNLSNYSPLGIPLEPGFVEVVEAGDPLEGNSQEHVGKIKIKAWRGPDYVDSTETDMAGVDWILAENWWPYQRPTFVTPPFAGYVSGHSTYSRAAAELLTLVTGDPYFPGGMGEYVAKKNEFLVFEEGPSVDVKLQWAKYTDASDQCSLSRIWGGIHPPADDINGRFIGKAIGIEGFNFADKFFKSNYTQLADVAICNGDSVEIFNEYRKIAGTYFDSLTNSKGCDSIVIQKLAVNPTYDIALQAQEICEGDSIMIFGQYEKTAGTYFNNLSTTEGCDSIESVELMVNPIYTTQLDKVEICEGDSALIFGNYEKTNGTYYNQLQSKDGCDSIISQELQVNPVYSITLPVAKICQGDSILIFGEYRKQSGTFTQSSTSQKGCDSLTHQQLIVNPVYNVSLPAITICDGDSALIFGKYEKVAHTYLNQLQTKEGCDSIISQKLMVNPTYMVNTKAVICNGDSIFLEGMYRKIGGVYKDPHLTTAGCDSIVVTTLTVNPLPTVVLKNFDKDTICTYYKPIPLPLGFPDDGVYAGSTGINGTIFDPSLTNIGLQNVIYTCTDTNLCSNSDTARITVDPCLGIEDQVGLLSKTQVYPNPNTGSFNIQLPDAINEDVQVKIYSTDGRLVFEKEMSVGDRDIKVDLRNAVRGMYYLQVQSLHDRAVKKIIKQ